MPARLGKQMNDQVTLQTQDVSPIQRLMLEALTARAAATAADNFLDTFLVPPTGTAALEDSSPSLATSSPSATQPSTRGASSSTDARNAASSDPPVSLSPPSHPRRSTTPLSERLRRFTIKNGLLVGPTASSAKASSSAGSADVPPLLPVPEPVPVPALARGGAATPPVSVSPQPCIPSPPHDGLPVLVALQDGAEAAPAPPEEPRLPELITPSGRNPHEGARQTMTHDPYSPVGFVLHESQCGASHPASARADHVSGAEALSGDGTEGSLEPDRASLLACHGVVPCSPGNGVFSAQAFGAGQMFEDEAMYASQVECLGSVHSSWVEKEAARSAMLYHESVLRSMVLQNLEFVYRMGAGTG